MIAAKKLHRILYDAAGEHGARDNALIAFAEFPDGQFFEACAHDRAKQPGPQRARPTEREYPRIIEFAADEQSANGMTS